MKDNFLLDFEKFNFLEYISSFTQNPIRIIALIVDLAIVIYLI